MKKIYTIELVTSKENLWHEDLIGKRFKVVEGHGTEKHLWFLANKPYRAIDGTGWYCISRKYCKIVHDPPTHKIKRRTIRCL